jgi:hypothetical protein
MRYLLLVVVLVLPCVGHAAVTGRVDSAHLDRLRSLANGRIEAESPSFDTAVGRIGTFGFGSPGCDAQGFSYRPIVHSKAVLQVNIPHGSNSLDIIVRATQGARELSVIVGNALWTRAQLNEGWQRVRIPLSPANEGPLVMELSLNKPVGRFEKQDALAPEVLGLFHALITKSTKLEDSVVEPQKESVSSSQLGWMEAGEILEIPVPVQKGQALEVRGLRVRGDASKLSLRVLLMSAQGAREEVANVAASLNLPWNLDVSRRGEMTPYWLRFEVDGEQGAVALSDPRLTVPGLVPESVASSLEGRPVVLIAVRNTSYEDAEATRVPMPGFPLSELRTTSTLEYEALTSLVTGHYPRAGKQKGAKQRKQSLVRMAKKNGRYASLVSAAFPRLEEAVGLGDFDHVRLSSPTTFGQSAEHVLAEAEKLLIDLRAKKTFTTIVLRDPGNPLSPQGDAWKRFYRGGQPVWKPANTRKVLLGIQKSGRALKKKEVEFLDALKKGAVQQSLRAVRDFSVRLENRRMKPIIVVVGLGSQAWPPRPNAMTVENTRIPAWIQGIPLPAAAADSVSDLTDIATTIAGLLRGGKSLMQGSDIRSALPNTWPETVFVRDPFGGKLVVTNRVTILLSSSRKVLSQQIRKRDKSGLTRWVDAPEDESQALFRESLRRQGSAHDGAGAAWHPSIHGATVRRGGESRRGKACRRTAP